MTQRQDRQCNLNECPWGPDEWRDLGAMDNRLGNLEQTTTSIKIKLDENHREIIRRISSLGGYKTRGTLAGVGGGSAGAGVLFAVYLYLKQKWPWLPLIFGIVFLTSCTMVRFDGVTYVSILQKKSLTVTADETGIRSISYTNDSDPAIQAFRDGLSLLAATATASQTGGIVK